jgi:hypothetical protein
MHCSRLSARTRLRSLRLAIPSIGALFMLFLLGAPTALAQSSERITFDFTGSSFISLLGGTIVTPPDGTMDIGVADIYVEASAPGVYVPGGVFLLDGMKVAGTIAKNVAGQADVTGTYSASQVSALAGTLAPGLTGGEFSSDLALYMNTQIGCTGTACGLLGFPVSDVGVSLFSVTFLPVSGIGVPGFAQINASFAIEVDGVLGTLDLVGVEVARSFIPEPGTFVLVASGFGILAASRRRRARSPV